MGIFKAYDIRGIYPSDLDTEIARKVGRAFSELLGPGPVVVGRDARVHSPEVSEAVCQGLRDVGREVINIGLASTPMVYYAIGSREVAGGMVVTASHNPGEYNGMKLCREGAKPVAYTTGIDKIEAACAGDGPAAGAEEGGMTHLDLLADYHAHVASFADLKEPVKVAIDAANGMAGYTLPGILKLIPEIQAESMFMEPDGTFPNHEANPLKEENLDPVRGLIASTGARVGVSFDGDADRCCFVDEKGVTVPADLITALLARDLLAQRGPVPIVYDLRSSWVVKEEVERAGGRAIRDRVGHSFIKATMREEGALFAGELSGHFYFADNFTTDSGVLAMISVLNLLSRNPGTPLSQLVGDLRRYHQTGEINFRVEDTAQALASLRETFPEGRVDELDGVTIECGDLGDDEWWWCNVRSSNTEPLLRLNLEANTAALRDARRDQVVELLGEPVE
ncbi:MAG: phosphomannomutase/phosphoglucomutase [Planctomycetes bacterium]|nr:phosphomannomutase/phosphoglucomutase [Planctomycetota bacterium]